MRRVFYPAAKKINKNSRLPGRGKRERAGEGEGEEARSKKLAATFRAAQ